MKRRRKVVFVIPSLAPTGAERQVLDLVNHIDTERFDATLFTFEKRTDLAECLNRDKVRLVRVRREFKLDARPVIRLARILRDDGVELVHCTLQISLFVAAAAAALSGRTVRLVDALHSYTRRDAREYMVNRFVYAPLMQRCARVITVCDAQRQVWAAKYPALAPKMTTIYNGIDLDKFRDDVPAAEKADLVRRLGVDPRRPILGMVAAIRPEKNHLAVLEALARLVAAGRRFTFLFLGGAVPGTETLEARVRERTRALGLEEYVRWLGWVSAPKQVVSILDAVVLFSTTEAFPMALLECLAIGKPVVSSDVGGIPEIVTHRRNGLLVPVGDVAALQSALDSILMDRELLRGLTVDARPSVEARFSVHEMARKTGDVLEAALRAPHSSV
jgi:glycosyltransferase involved in cell wall biosynthesis